MVHPNTVVVQHVTMCELSAEELMELWSGALLVTSFHDLDRYISHHGPQRQHAIRWGTG
jgi:hypothetical protein